MKLNLSLLCLPFLLVGIVYCCSCSSSTSSSSEMEDAVAVRGENVESVIEAPTGSSVSNGYSAESMIDNLNRVSEYISFIQNAIISYDDLILQSAITQQLTNSLAEYKEDVLKSFKLECKAIHIKNWISKNAPDSSSSLYPNKKAYDSAVKYLDRTVSRKSSPSKQNRRKHCSSTSTSTSSTSTSTSSTSTSQEIDFVLDSVNNLISEYLKKVSSSEKVDEIIIGMKVKGSAGYIAENELKSTELLEETGSTLKKLQKLFSDAGINMNMSIPSTFVVDGKKNLAKLSRNPGLAKAALTASFAIQELHYINAYEGGNQERLDSCFALTRKSFGKIFKTYSSSSSSDDE